jgi:hypothetical protein
MILNEDKKIEDLINDSYNEKIWLPEFQRPFVWDKNQIRLLIDSLYQNYTISSILTWKGNDELSRRRVGGGIADIKVPLNDSEEKITYLLDGQQRTTALTYVFTDKKIYKGKNKNPAPPLNLYYDSEYRGDEAEKRWLFDDEVIYDSDNSEHSFKIRELLKKKELHIKFGIRFIKIKHLMIDNLENEFSLEDDNQKYKFLFEYGKIVNLLKDKILKRKVVDIEQRGNLNSVLEVFERINTKNTKLSIFDIMVAKTYKKFDEGYFDLRTYLKIITSEESSVKENYFENIKNIKDIEKYKNPFVDELLLFLIMMILKKEFKATFIIKISTDDLMNNIKNIHFILKRTLEILNNNFHIEYDRINDYKPIAKFIVAFLARYDNDTNYGKFLNNCLWNTLLYNRYPGAQNERIEKDFKRISRHILNLEIALKEMKADNSRSFDSIINSTAENKQLFNCFYHIGRGSTRNQLYKSILLLFKHNNLRDFYTGEKPSINGTKITKLEQHHIFPLNSSIGKEISNKYKNSEYYNIINNIANISLITKETNNTRISNKNPSIYIKEFEDEYYKKGNIEDFYQIMESQFIDRDMIRFLREDRFEEFLVARTKLIYHRIIKLTTINY